MDIESEKRDLSNVFNILGVESNKYSSRLDTHFSKFDEARKKWLESNALNTVSFAAIYNASKTHALVQHYHQLEKNKKEIFQHRDKFFSILNDLFDGRKIISISERSELIVHTKDGKQIPLEELSSGEKQLIIILGEALLQEGEPVVYIADEPELSLHVKWQEMLTDAISELNPDAQIVFGYPLSRYC